MWTVGFCAARNLSFYGPLRNSPPQMPSWPSAPGVPRSGTQRAAATTARCVPLFGEDTQPPRVASWRYRRSPRAPSAFDLSSSLRQRGVAARRRGGRAREPAVRRRGSLELFSLPRFVMKKKRGVVPGTRCLPRRMDPPSSRHPGCRRDVATLCRRPRTACSRSLARQQRRRAVRCVVGVGDVSLWDYVVATRASCLSRFEAKRCCGATL